ncbi:MAG: hypothetical protein ACI9EF_003027 [Pseudohongiellaceae bacterium]
MSIRGLNFDATAEDPANLLIVQDCAGAVLFEDCVMDAAADGSGISSGLQVIDCESVSVTRCEVSGGFGFFGQVGIAAANAKFFLYASTISGSGGQDAGMNSSE